MRTQADDLRAELKKVERNIAECERKGYKGNILTHLNNERYRIIDTLNNIR